MNCSEVLSQELGLINASKTLVGSLPVTTSSKVTKSKLVLFFMKKLLANNDGSSDLITVVTIVHHNVNKTLVLTILKKITDKYIEFKRDAGHSAGEQKPRLGEFKLYMNQIIKYEEMNYEAHRHEYNYGGSRNASETDLLLGQDAINPSQLLLVNEEVEEVRQVMLSNINKLLSRGDKINLLVEQTDRLTSSSLLFQKKAHQIKRDMRLNAWQFYALLVSALVAIVYLMMGGVCGFPAFGRCI